MSSKLVRIVSLLMVGSWVGLLLARGRFWDPPVDRLSEPLESGDAPDVAIVVPARNEAALLPATLPTLFAQRYAGAMRIVLADDGSTDGTAARANWLATEAGATKIFSVASIAPRPAGWAGKVWAMAGGIDAIRHSGARPAYWLFTDADIAHDPDLVGALVATAREDRRDLVSLMVQLHCESAWERRLIPAFVFFFAKLYPFAWIADNRRRTAGAAGGCILISDDLLERIGGVAAIWDALIDDCALAAAAKAAGGSLRLELTTKSRSLRPYPSLAPIWNMVARSAYTQLHRSPAIVAGTTAGMVLLYAAPPLAVIAGIVRREPIVALSGVVTLGLMGFAYQPILRRYGQRPQAAAFLPVAAVYYTAMTIDSALRHWRGQGGVWKGRVADDVERGRAGAPPELVEDVAR